MPDKGWRRFDCWSKATPISSPLAPDDMTGNVRAVRFKDQVETFGDIQGLVTSSDAPEMDMFRIRQFIVRTRSLQTLIPFCVARVFA